MPANEWGKGQACSVAQACATLHDPMDCGSPGSSIHGIFQARILQWVTISFSRGSSWPRDPTEVSCSSCIVGGFFISEPPGKPWEGVQFSRSVMSDSLRPHELQHARPPCLSPTPRVYSNPCPSSRWCHPTISSSVVPFSCPQFLPASRSSPMSQLFPWGGQSTGVSASASVLPMNTQDWSSSGWTGKGEGQQTQGGGEGCLWEDCLQERRRCLLKKVSLEPWWITQMN